MCEYNIMFNYVNSENVIKTVITDGKTLTTKNFSAKGVAEVLGEVLHIHPDVKGMEDEEVFKTLALAAKPEMCYSHGICDVIITVARKNPLRVESGSRFWSKNKMFDVIVIDEYIAEELVEMHGHH